MENSQDLDFIAAHAIRHQVARARHHQFARSGEAPGASHCGMIGEKPDGQPWKCWEMDRMDVSHMRLHFVYFHRVDAGNIDNPDLVAVHRIEHERGQYSIEHEHGGIR